MIIIKETKEYFRMRTKYAVIIVTYNRELLLRECIDNVKNQIIVPDSIIIVNNASTDGTYEYLEELTKKSELFDIIHLSKNTGGAGGFAKGIECALQKDVDSVLIIDDDAMIEKDYMQKILQIRLQNPQYRAFAGTVKINERIDTFHRRNLQKAGLISRNCKEWEYGQPSFACDIASFCGMVVDTGLIRQIGLPHAEYFIWYDDTEYSLRIHQYSKILVVTAAVLNHKTSQNVILHPRRYDWKDYYAVRNRLLMVREHGNFIDRMVNFIDLFIHIIFRNWIFAIIKRDNYNWEYERSLVSKAIKNAKDKELKNVIIRREERK